MPTYHMRFQNLKGEWYYDAEGVYVPTEVKGLNDVAEYISEVMGQRYAASIASSESSVESIAGMAKNWSDMHTDVIREALVELRDNLKAKRHD